MIFQQTPTLDPQKLNKRPGAYSRHYTVNIQW